MSIDKPIYEKVITSTTNKYGEEENFYADLRYRKTLRTLVAAERTDDLDLIKMRQLNARNKVKTVRFTFLEIRLLNALAGYHKLSSSEYIRNLIWADLRKINLVDEDSKVKEEL